MTIARIAIPDGRALRSIGLGTKRSKKVDEDGGEDDLVDDDLGDDEDPVIDAPPPN
ncbi:MAG: hypothetical protein R3B72_51675 [Polyangiaceae bacterium]